MNLLLEYFSYPFVRNALVVGVLIALCSSLLGVTLVLKRYSYIGDGLSHVAFGATAVSGVLSIDNNIYFVLPITILVAILLLKGGNKTKIRADANLAMLSVSALAFGYLVMNISSSSVNISGDVCQTLFGSISILTLGDKEVYLCIVLSIAVIVFYIYYYNCIFAISFDEEFSKTIGIKVEFYNLIMAIVVAVIVVLSMNLVGSLLISALIVFPAISAMRLYDSFKKVTICSAILSVVGALVGMLVSILWGTPVGSSIVAIDAFIFLLSCLIKRIKGIKRI